MTGRTALLACCGVVLLAPDDAQAQTAPTCAFDLAAARVTVTVDGLAAHLRAFVASGEIRLNGEPCGGATVFNTDAIQVNGSPVWSDTVSLRGSFAPGLTPEPTGGSEIEISFADVDWLVVDLTPRNDRLIFTSDGIDIGNDGDRDILTPGTGRITVNADGGNDRIDASAYSSVRPVYGTLVELHGGPGRDVLIGSTVASNDLYGEDGDDLLEGGNGRDRLYGGMGNDRLFGGGGDDWFYQEATVDGADDMFGGSGLDWVSYKKRTTGVTVTIGDTQLDGEPGEGDRVHADIENVMGGQGPDVLVGNTANNDLDGRGGDDELYGGAGADRLFGMAGKDILVGDGGNDSLWGGQQDDFLDGGLGADVLYGEAGNDILHGGPGGDTLDGGELRDEFHGDDGNDTFINDDGYAETVDCGPGLADDPQPSSLDTFIACEQI